MGDLVADDGADGREVHVPGDVGVKEQALKNSGGKFDEISVAVVERVDDGHVAVLEPRFSIDLFSQAIVVKDSPGVSELNFLLCPKFGVCIEFCNSLSQAFISSAAVSFLIHLH